MITRRAALVVVVGFCFYLIALVNVLPSFYYALAWLMAGMLVSSLGLAVMSLSGLQCTWKPRRQLAQEELSENATGSSPSLLMEFSNRGTLNKTGVLVEVTLRDVVRKSTFTRCYLMEALVSGSKIATEIPLQKLKRGEYTIESLRLIGSDVLGFFRISRHVFRRSDKTPDAGRFIVGPAVLANSNNLAVAERAFSWSGSGSMKWGQHSDEIRGIRAYAPGDDLRDVHWASTARLGHLAVKEFTRPLEQRVLVVWDGTLEFNRHGEALEWGLRFCASLVANALEKQTPCGLLLLTSTPVLLGGINSPAPLTMAAAQEALALAEANRLSVLSEAMRPYFPYAVRYGQLSIISPHSNPDTAQMLASWRASGGYADLLQINVQSFEGRSAASSPRQAAVRPAASWPLNGDHSAESARKTLRQFASLHGKRL